MKNVDHIERLTGRQRALAIARARAAAERLEALGVEASIIGSLASDRFSMHSDVDFLVTECPRHLKYAIEGIVEEMLEGLRFDVVYLDDLPVDKRDRFLREAVSAKQIR